jgi:repressor LexA
MTSAMSTSLPPGQRKILDFFADAEDAGHQPSRAEVAEAMGYAFPSAVSKHVDALVRKGLLAADREKKRNVRLTESGWASIDRTPAKKGVPVIGAIAAGTPILATESHAGYLTDIQPVPGRFALKVRGDSMIDAGILDGDFAVIQADTAVANGHIGAVVVDGEATLKRIRYHGDRIELIPENPRYQPLVISKAKNPEIKIVGPLCFIYRTVT